MPHYPNSLQPRIPELKRRTVFPIRPPRPRVAGGLSAAKEPPIALSPSLDISSMVSLAISSDCGHPIICFHMFEVSGDT